MTFPDPDFDLHMALLSLNSTDVENDDIRRKEEMRMTPIFSPRVRNVIEDKEHGSQTLFPQFGLFCGLLSAFPDNSDKQNEQEELGGDERGDPRLFLNVNTPWSTFICGSQGSGKSHTLSCMLENCILPSSGLGKVPRPLAAMVFHYDKFNSYNSGQICEAAFLCSLGIQVTVLVSPSNVWNMTKAYTEMPSLPEGAPRPVVKPLYLKDKHLSIDIMKRLMAVSESNGPLPLYMEVIYKILRQMAREMQGTSFNYNLFKAKLRTEGFSDKQNEPLKLRLELLESFLEMENTTNSQSIASQSIWEFAPGSLTIIDLSCPFVDEASACALFDICLGIFLQARQGGRVVALDEAHKYMTDTASAQGFSESLLSIIRLQRHLGTRVIISTQEPTISPRLLDLSSMTIIHNFSSPTWMSVLKTHLAGASGENAETTVGKKRDVESIFATIVNLNVGEALLFSPNAMLDVKQGLITKLGMGYLKVRIRKRLTADGGRSVLAN